MPHPPRTPDGTTPVRILAWGIDTDDIDTALHAARAGWSRSTWNVVEEQRLTGETCPIDVQDPAAVAAHGAPGWAYAVYPVREGA